MLEITGLLKKIETAYSLVGHWIKNDKRFQRLVKLQKPFVVGLDSSASSEDKPGRMHSWFESEVKQILLEQSRISKELRAKLAN